MGAPSRTEFDWPSDRYAIVEVPLARLFEAESAGRMKDHMHRDIDYYSRQEHRVWGATARILNNLCEALGQPCEPSHLQ
ncbi:MAG TPA: hypothetical protein VIR57_22710 [Chloroflexota bacterium]